MPLLKSQTIHPRNSFETQNPQGYSLSYLPQSNSLLLFGVLSNSDVLLFSLSKKQWSLVKTSGKKPSFRRFFAHYYLKSISSLIIHGGQIIQNQKKLKSSQQCYILFTSNWNWRKIFIQEGPSPRQYHRFIDYQTPQNKIDLFVFGGFSKPYQTFLNDLWSFRNLQNLSTKTNKHQVHGCQSKTIMTKGAAPYLYGYQAKVIDKKILFFGGESNNQRKKLQIFVFYLSTLTWQKVDVLSKVCPNLKFLSIFQSAIDIQKIHIFGGYLTTNNKINDKCYYLGLKQMKVFEQSKSKLPQNLIHSCCITESPLCIASVQLNNQGQQMDVNVMYQKQQSNVISKHFETDEIEDSKQQASIEQYLKAIKHQQILSQQIIKKNLVLEELYKQIQRYISSLYGKYLNDSSNEVNQQIEGQKAKNIRSCQQLKQSYIQNALQFEEITSMIKILRSQLGEIHQDFERCIETQIDEEDN